MNNIQLRSQSMSILNYGLIALVIAFALFTRIISVFQYITFDIGPAPDQIRDAFVYINMWQGQLPHYGPWASVGQYFLPPLYYYLIFPFTIFGANPAFQALGNGVYSFLSILVLMYLVYQLLDNIDRSKRLTLTGLAGFWYSSLYSEFFLSNFHFNPTPIPLFIFVFSLLFQYLIRQKNFVKEVIAWVFYGIVLAILVSLHSTTLFIMPVVFIISCIWFIYRYRKEKRKWGLPLVGVVAANVALSLYWKIEVSRGFSNSKRVLNLIFERGQDSGSLLSRLDVLFDYFDLGQQVYFLGNGGLIRMMASSFLAIVTVLGVLYYKGNQPIFRILVLTWLIYLLVASNYQDEYFFVSYKLPILFAPIILATSTLAYVNYQYLWQKIIKALILGIIALSIVINLHSDILFLSSKYGLNRVISVGDIVDIFEKIPEGSTVCYPKKQGNRSKYNQYDYIDSFITQKNLKIIHDCQSGYYFLQPKSKIVVSIDDSFPLFSIHKNSQQPEIFQIQELFWETPVAYVYILSGAENSETSIKS